MAALSLVNFFDKGDDDEDDLVAGTAKVQMSIYSAAPFTLDICLFGCSFQKQSSITTHSMENLKTLIMI